MQITIIGGGEIGYALAKALAPQHDIFVVANSPAVADRFSHLDVEFVLGSGTSGAVLRSAGADTSELAIACTGSDEVNMVACSLASQHGARQTVCFVSKHDLLHEIGADGLREHFGIDRVIWPEAQLAAAIERIIMAPGAIDAEAFAGGEIRLLEYRLEEGSPLTRGTVASSDLPPGVVIVAVKHGETTTIPRGPTRLAVGDKVVLMGTREPMSALQGRIFGSDRRRAARAPRLVTIIGGGDVGFRLAQDLEAAPGIELRVIERDPARGQMLAGTLSRALILNGDGTDLELLESLEIGRSDVLVSVINNDERNLLASLLGRQLGVGKIITRVSKPGNLRLFQRVGIDVALSARGAAVASVIHQIDGGKASLLAVLEEGQAKVVELTVPADYPPTALRDLKAPRESVVGSILRGQQVIVPSGEDQIQAGDRLLVCCTDASAHLVRDLFTSSAA